MFTAKTEILLRNQTPVNFLVWKHSTEIAMFFPFSDFLHFCRHFCHRYFPSPVFGSHHSRVKPQLPERVSTSVPHLPHSKTKHTESLTYFSVFYECRKRFFIATNNFKIFISSKKRQRWRRYLKKYLLVAPSSSSFGGGSHVFIPPNNSQTTTPLKTWMNEGAKTVSFEMKKNGKK